MTTLLEDGPELPAGASLSVDTVGTTSEGLS